MDEPYNVRAHRRDSSCATGPGSIAWDAAEPKQKNGQRPISVSKLAKAMDKVRPDQGSLLQHFSTTWVHSRGLRGTPGDKVKGGKLLNAKGL